MPDPDWARRRQGYWQFRDYHGRLFDLGEESFMLPADGEESNRLEAQHHMLKLALGGLYITPEDVERALAPREGRAPAVLDIGTGNGTWAIEMAKRFPHCEVIGMDLAPPQPLQYQTLPWGYGVNGHDRDVPVNCKFEIEDANFPMLHYANTFDVVHCRLVDGGIKDYPKFLNEIARILRPGGVVLLGKGIHQLYLHPAENVWDPLPVVPEGHPRYTNCQTMFTAVWNAARKNGGSEFATLYYKFWLENNPNFGTPTPRDLYIPISPWINGLTDKERYVCEMKREDMKELFKAFKPILKRDGYSDEQADKWIHGTRMELDRMTVHAYAKWIYCSAVRGNTPFQENVTYPPRPNYSFS